MLSGKFTVVAVSLAAHQDEDEVFRCRLVSDSNFLPKGC